MGVCTNILVCVYKYTRIYAYVYKCNCMKIIVQSKRLKDIVLHGWKKASFLFHVATALSCCSQYTLSDLFKKHELCIGVRGAVGSDSYSSEGSGVFGYVCASLLLQVSGNETNIPECLCEAKVKVNLLG